MNMRNGLMAAALSVELLGVGVKGTACGGAAPPPPAETKKTTEKIAVCATTVGAVALINAAQKEFKVESLFTPPNCAAEDSAPVYAYNLDFTQGIRQKSGQIVAEETFIATCVNTQDGVVGIESGIDRGVIVPEKVVLDVVKSTVNLPTCSPSAG